MSVYAATPEGVAALRKSASDISEAATEISSKSSSLESEIQSYTNRIGPHEDKILGVIEAIVQAMNGMQQSAETIASALNETAEGYQEVVDNDPYSGLGN